MPSEIKTVIPDIGYILAASSSPPASVMNLIASANTLLNAAIGLALTLVIVAWMFHIARWAILGRVSTLGKASVVGATRAFFAFFVLINIWFFFRIIQLFMNIAPPVAYAIMLFSVVLVCCWSLLNVGEIFVDAISWVVNSSVTACINLLRSSGSPARRWLQGFSDDMLRFVVLVVIIACTTIFSFFGCFDDRGEAQCSALRAGFIDSVIPTK